MGSSRPFANSRRLFQLNKTIYENTILCIYVKLSLLIKYLQVFSCGGGRFSYPLFFSVIVKLFMKIYVYNVHVFIKSRENENTINTRLNKVNCLLRKNFKDIIYINILPICPNGSHRWFFDFDRPFYLLVLKKIQIQYTVYIL